MKYLPLLFLVLSACNETVREQKSDPGENLVDIAYDTVNPDIVMVSIIPYYVGDNRSTPDKVTLIYGEPDTLINVNSNVQSLCYTKNGIEFWFAKNELFCIALNLNNSSVDTLDRDAYQFVLDGFRVQDRTTIESLIMSGVNFDEKSYKEDKSVTLFFSEVYRPKC